MVELGGSETLVEKAAARQTLTHTWYALMHTRTLSNTRTPIHALSHTRTFTHTHTHTRTFTHTHAGILESKPGAKKQVTPFSVDRFRFAEKPIKKILLTLGSVFKPEQIFLFPLTS